MDTEQLFSSAQTLLLAFKKCELLSALHSDLSGNTDFAAISLTSASSQYLETVSVLGEHEKLLASSAQIDMLQSPSYWFDLDTGSAEERRVKKFACLRTILTGQSFLVRLSRLVEENADPLDSKENAADIKIRLVDAADLASDPDRISRLIDGVDLIYRACARLAQLSEDGLQVMRIGGSGGRTIVFTGDVEPATAARRIIRAASDIASISIQSEHYSADEVADGNPFMRSLDDLFRIGALSADDAEDIRQGVLSGSIMVLECGARLCGNDGGLDEELAQQRVMSEPGGGKSSLLDHGEALEYLDLSVSRD